MFVMYRRSGRLSLISALVAIPAALMVAAVATLALVGLGVAAGGVALVRVFGGLRPIRRVTREDDITIDGVVVRRPSIEAIGPHDAAGHDVRS